MYQKIFEKIINSDLYEINLISKENLKDYCCICNIKNLLDYEYFSLLDISDRNHGFFLKINSKIIGEIIFYIKNSKVTIEIFCIKEKYQGLDYGSFLLKEFISFCKKNNVTEISLISLNNISDNFYKKNGFIKESDYFKLKI